MRLILEMIGITLDTPVMTILLEGNLNGSNYFQNFIIDFDFIERITRKIDWFCWDIKSFVFINIWIF